MIQNRKESKNNGQDHGTEPIGTFSQSADTQDASFGPGYEEKSTKNMPEIRQDLKKNKPIRRKF